MRHGGWSWWVVRSALVLAVGLGCGCQAMTSIDKAADDFSELAKSATKLADASVETIEDARTAMAAIGKHAGTIGDRLDESIPRLTEDTRRMVDSFQSATRDMGAATTKAVEQTAETMKAITPELKSTLGTLGETAVKYGSAVEKIGTELTATGRSLNDLVLTMRQNNATNREWLRTTKEQLNASMQAAEKTLEQTATSLANTEEGILKALDSSQQTLASINRILRLEADDEDEMQMIQRVTSKVDRAITAFLWVFLGGGILLVVVTTILVYDKLTARSRLERHLRAMGYKPPQDAALDA